MSDFVEAYDTTTGTKLPYPVPAHYIGHPVLGRNLSLTPRENARPRATTPPEKAPAAGDDKKE